MNYKTVGAFTRAAERSYALDLTVVSCLKFGPFPQFTSNAESRITDRDVFPSSTLGGDMHLQQVNAFLVNLHRHIRNNWRQVAEWHLKQQEGG